MLLSHPQNVIQLLSDLLSNQIIRIETINNDDDLNDGYIEGIQKYLWKRVVKHDPATGNIKILFEYVEPQLCRICDPDRNKFWTYTTVIENINAHVKIDKLRDIEKRIAKISSLFTKNISKRIIVYTITNYDIHTNEMLNLHQHHLNNNKNHTVGLNADLLKINSAFSQLYRAQIFECAWLDFEARKNSNIARLLQEKNMTPICCCPENTTKQIENCRMYTFKDPTLKEATLATIIDQFQHDYSSKMALFIESKKHLCKSCGGDSDSLIFLTPVQKFNEKRKYFQQLRNKIKHVDNLTKNTKPSSSFSPMAIGGRKDTIEGETYAKIPFHLQETSLTHSDSPIRTIYPTRSSTEIAQSISMNDKKKNLSKEFGKISSKNNNYYESNLNINKQTKSCNEFLKIYLLQQTKNRLIINRFRLFTRRLFKFRRKKSLNRVQLFNQSQNFNQNNNHIIIEQISNITIEQILNRQWIQAFENKKSEKKISLIKLNSEESSCSSLSITDENYSYSIDSIHVFCQSNKQLNNQIQKTSQTRISNHLTTIYGLNQTIEPLKCQLKLNSSHFVHDVNKIAPHARENYHSLDQNNYIHVENSLFSNYDLSQHCFSHSGTQKK
ncbi:unnamed protein product [Rotaria sp. Silwood2]|nr:unnamed protein product [Rotaria sp. Silwood2]